MRKNSPSTSRPAPALVAPLLAPPCPALPVAVAALLSPPATYGLWRGPLF